MKPSRLIILITLSVTLGVGQLFAGQSAPPSPSAKPGATCVKALGGDLDVEWLQEKAQGQREELTPLQQRLRDTLQSLGFYKVALNLKIIRDHVNSFTNSLEQKVAANQRQSGRCWLFASLNVLRSRLLAEKKFDTASEFSEAHMHFANMLEKSNKLLENAINNSAKKMPAEKFRQALEVDSNSIGDGGEYAWFVFLVNKYGLVPKEKMPETASSQNTAALLDELRKQLGVITVELTAAAQNMKSGRGKFSVEDMNTLRAIKSQGMARVMKILTSHLGEFIYPDETFTWRRTVKGTNGAGDKTLVETFTPKSFAKDFVGFNPDDFVTVSSTVLQPFNQTYVIKNSSIGVEARGQKKANLHYINLPIDRLKELIKTTIDMKIPVYFGSDVRRDVDFDSGIMNTEIFDTEPIYGYGALDQEQDLTHKQEVSLGIAEAVHAMVFTGYDQPPGEKDKNGNDKVIKYQVENTWGGKLVGGVTLPQNNLSAYDNWVDKYVFEIVVPRAALNADELALLARKPIVIKDSVSYYGEARR